VLDNGRIGSKRMAIGVNPARHEIERQLDHMLAHPLFEARDLQADIFAFLVTSALDSKEVTELTLFEEFYTVEEFKHRSTKVRTNVNHMRGLLQKYYAGDGEGDSVVIALPAPERTQLPDGKYKIVKRPRGEAYTPVFSYNPRSPIAKAFAIANHLLRGSLSQIDRGVKQLGEIQNLAPDHPDAWLAVAETVGTYQMLGLYDGAVREALTAWALDCIAKLDPASADEWRIHNVRGLLLMAGGEFDNAQKEFDRALAIDRQATISRGLYALFLFQTGKEEEALRLQGLLADEKAANAEAQAIYGVYLTRANRYEEAEKAFTQSLTLDRNCWGAHYGMTQMYLATKKGDLALKHAKRLETLVEPEEFEDLKRRLGIEPRGPERSV
jgi:tetratricopeptide (TPR) repeat protein